MSDEVKGPTDECQIAKMTPTGMVMLDTEQQWRAGDPVWWVSQALYDHALAAKDKDIGRLREGLRLADTLAGLCNWHDAKDMPGLTAARDAYRASRKGQK